jgi:membrane protein implicated in regulation of membrane protease activity
MATSLWMAGSLNECWVVFFVLLFLVPYRILVSEKGELKHPVIAALVVVPIGFLAGAFNFQSFGLSIGFVVLTIIFVILQQRRLPAWSIIGLLSTICGTLFVLLAPGNKVECLRKYGYTPIGLYLHKFPGNVFDAFNWSYKVTKVLLLFSVIVFVWLIIDVRKTNKSNLKKKKRGKQIEHKFTYKSLFDNKSVFFIPGLFLITAVGSVVVATALPYVDFRLFFTVFVSFALVFFSLLSVAVDRIENSESKLKNAFSNKYLRIAVPVLISLITVFDFGKEFRIYHRDYVVYTNVVHSIEEKIAAGDRNIVIHKNSEIRPFLYPDGRLHNFIFYWSITGAESDPNTMLNKWYAYYLGVDTLTGGE